MHIIFGLGNPGKKYQNTRHNLGFMVLDELASRWGQSFSKDHLFFDNLRKIEAPHDVELVKPQTYMNRSGDVLHHYISDPGFSSEKLLVIVDDFALPLGKIRIRPRGSDGGHNGLASIIDVLGHNNFPRLRLGIGMDETIPVIDYVLASFENDEQEVVDSMIQKAADAVLDFLVNDVHQTMNMYN